MQITESFSLAWTPCDSVPAHPISLQLHQPGNKSERKEFEIEHFSTPQHAPVTRLIISHDKSTHAWSKDRHWIILFAVNTHLASDGHSLMTPITLISKIQSHQGHMILLQMQSQSPKPPASNSTTIINRLIARTCGCHVWDMPRLAFASEPASLPMLSALLGI